MTPDAQIVLLPPLNVYRRMEKVFAVAVDRSPDKSRQKTFLLSGLEEDINEAVEFLQQADFSGGVKISVDPKLLPQLIGKGGSGIRQLEETFKSFFQTRENNDVVVYGSKLNAAKAIEHISRMKVERQGQDQVSAVVPVEHAAIARSLATVFSKHIRDIETKNAVNTRISAGPPPNTSTSAPETAFGVDVSSEKSSFRSQTTAPSTKPSAHQQSVIGAPSITIRGPNKNAVESARTAVATFVSSIRVVEIPSNSDALKRLFSRVSFNGEVDLGRGPRSPSSRASSNLPSVSDRFCDLVGLNNDVAFIRHGDTIAIVGLPDAIARVHQDTKQLVEVAGYTSVKIIVQSQQLPILSASRLAEIGEATKATLSVRRLRGGDSASIEILGNDQEKSDAARLLNDIIEKEGAIQLINIEERETLNQLFRKSGALIRSLEEQYGTRISVDRSQMSCSVMGNPDGIALIRGTLNEMDRKNAELETRSINLPSADMIRRLIGTKGSTISQIRSSSKVEAIDINDRELVAVIRGTSKACDEAEKQIHDVLSSSILVVSYDSSTARMNWKFSS